MIELPAAWLRWALDPPPAHGAPLVRARLRSAPENFRVDELLGFEAAGQGSHLLLQVQKRGANTEWVARELARRARVRPHEVGFAGLKDRHALTTQWYTVPAQRPDPAQWLGLRGEGYEVIGAAVHHRKLRRGVIAGNRFDIRLTDMADDIDRDLVAQRLESIRQSGVPNYFGPQRFGRNADNLRRACLAARTSAAREQAASHDDRQPPRDDRQQRSFALSAARSLIFNAVLAQRVVADSWNRLLDGDIANFDDGGTVFSVPQVDAALAARCQAGELHPTGPMWGSAALEAQAAVQLLERETAARCAPLDAWLLAEGLSAERRALRLRVADLEHEWDAGGAALRLRFALRAGGFATVVLRELVASAGLQAEPDFAA